LTWVTATPEKRKAGSSTLPLTTLNARTQKRSGRFDSNGLIGCHVARCPVMVIQ
jgi:hypothetical protein